MKEKNYSVKWKTLAQVMKEKSAMDTPELKKKMLKVAYSMFDLKK